jgi:hypothetical protein
MVWSRPLLSCCPTAVESSQSASSLLSVLWPGKVCVDFLGGFLLAAMATLQGQQKQAERQESSASFDLEIGQTAGVEPRGKSS